MNRNGGYFHSLKNLTSKSPQVVSELKPEEESKDPNARCSAKIVVDRLGSD